MTKPSLVVAHPSTIVQVLLLLGLLAAGCQWGPSIAESCTSRSTHQRRTETETTLLSPILEAHLAPLHDAQKTDVPFFWHIPKSAGTTIHLLVADCMNMVIAAEVGRVDHSHSLEIIQANGDQYVNVDTTTPKGIDRASEMGFAEANLADIVFSSYFQKATTELFTEDHRAVMFSLFRHPVERQVSLFYYLQHANWEATYHPEWQDMTLKKYATSNQAEHDWMTRFLVDKPTQELNDSDLELAKSILKNNFLIGLVHNMEESVERFGAFFGWNEDERWASCIAPYVSGGSNVHKHQGLDTNSEEWAMLAADNKYDIELYDYAVTLYMQQSVLFNEDEKA